MSYFILWLYWELCLQLDVWHLMSTLETKSKRTKIKIIIYFHSLPLSLFSYSRIIKLTSPNLNYTIGGGSLIMYSSIIFLLLPGLDTYSLHLRCIVSQTGTETENLGMNI